MEMNEKTITLKEIRERIQVYAYSDGSCKPNPGSGGWGAVVMYETETHIVTVKGNGGKYNTTNNEMELEGAIQMFGMCPKQSDIIATLDSQYVLSGLVSNCIDDVLTLKNNRIWCTGYIQSWISHDWMINAGTPKGSLQRSTSLKSPSGSTQRKNTQLWKKLMKECESHLLSGSTIRLKWVKGHTGNEGNEIANTLAEQGVSLIPKDIPKK
jgi:ribonuclease HI